MLRKHPLLTVVVGFTNTGKSTLVEKLVMNRKRVLAVTPHFKEWQNYENITADNRGYWRYNGTYRCQVYPGVMNDITGISMPENHFRNGVLILEESDLYIDRHAEKSVKTLLGSRDQWKVDIYLTAHGLTEIPPIFLNYVDVFIFFKTQDNLAKRKRDINSIWYDDLVKLQTKVNKQAKYDIHYYDTITTK